MSGPPSTSREFASAFTVTLAGDPRFIDAIRLLTQRAAEADGCAAASAARLGEAVERVLAALFASVRAPLTDGVTDLSFKPLGDAFCVEIRVPTTAVQAAGTTLERSVAEQGSLTSLAPGAEFGQAGPHQYCRIACPHAASPHRR